MLSQWRNLFTVGVKAAAVLVQSKKSVMKLPEVGLLNKLVLPGSWGVRDDLPIAHTFVLLFNGCYYATVKVCAVQRSISISMVTLSNIWSLIQESDLDYDQEVVLFVCGSNETKRCQVKSCRWKTAHIQLLTEVTNTFPLINVISFPF